MAAALMLLMMGWCRASTSRSAGQSSAVLGCHAWTALWNLSVLQPFSARSSSILALCCNFLSVGLWLHNSGFRLTRSELPLQCLLSHSNTLHILLVSIRFLTSVLLGGAAWKFLRLLSRSGCLSKTYFFLWTCYSNELH